MTISYIPKYNDWETELFFPVSLRAIFFGEEKDQRISILGSLQYHSAPRFRAVVDDERNHMFTCVSTSYHIITNRFAYDLGLKLADIVAGHSKGL